MDGFNPIEVFLAAGGDIAGMLWFLLGWFAVRTRPLWAAALRCGQLLFAPPSRRPAGGRHRAPANGRPFSLPQRAGQISESQQTQSASALAGTGRAACIVGGVSAAPGRARPRRNP
jgi:hypothetical protein